MPRSRPSVPDFPKWQTKMAHSLTTIGRHLECDIHRGIWNWLLNSNNISPNQKEAILWISMQFCHRPYARKIRRCSCRLVLCQVNPEGERSYRAKNRKTHIIGYRRACRIFHRGGGGGGSTMWAQ